MTARLGAVGLLLALALGLVWRPAGDAALPRPVALVSTWATALPMAGFRCSGILMPDDQLVTAAHCRDEPLLVVTTGSLCSPVPDGSRRVEPLRPGERPAAPSAVDVSVIPRGPAARGRTLGAPRAGAAVLVAGFGVDPGSGRPACESSVYRGTVRRCATSAETWCVAAGTDVQLCGGSSGAPVFLDRQPPVLIGVISGGPACGRGGDAVVATRLE